MAVDTNQLIKGGCMKDHLDEGQIDLKRMFDDRMYTAFTVMKVRKILTYYGYWKLERNSI